MHRGWIWLLAAVVLATGCVGGTPGDEPVTATDVKQRPEVVDAGQGTGSIQGVVTDTAVQPIEGARVALAGTDIETRTARDGSYEFTGLAVATYTVTASATGYVPGSETVQVSEGRSVPVDMLLVPLASDLPYSEEFEFTRLIEWGMTAGVQTPVTSFGGMDISCSNDAPCAIALDLAAPIRTLVVEATWDSTSPVSDELLFGMHVRVDALVTDGTQTLAGAQTTSPALVRIDHPDFTELDLAFRAKCEEGAEEYCGYGFWDEGWPVVLTMWPPLNCLTGVVDVCPVVQQQVDFVITAFYNAPAPEGFTQLE